MEKSACDTVRYLLSKRFFYGLVNWILFLTGCVNLIFGTWSALQENTAIATASITAGLFLLLAATIDRFDSLKGFGLEAKGRQLDKKIDEADDALRKLRKMTELTGSALIDLNTKIGRTGAKPSAKDLIDLASSVRKIMLELKSDEIAIVNSLRSWALTLCRDISEAHISKIYYHLNEELRCNINPAIGKFPASKRDCKEYHDLCEKNQLINKFINTELNKYRLWDLEDYPDKLMDMFDKVPVLEPVIIARIRSSLMRFVPGMNALKNGKELPDAEFWAASLDKAELGDLIEM